MSEEFVLENIFFYTEKNAFRNCIAYIRDIITNSPHPIAIYAARYLLSNYARDIIPDWVAALANGDPQYWDDLVDIVLDEMTQEVEDDSCGD